MKPLCTLVFAAAIACANTAKADPETEARVYFFGNSLIHHLTDTDLTTVPHWLALMARQADTSFAADGRFGFPREMAAELPPRPDWHFAEVTPAWEPADQSFAGAGFDTVILNPENYIQYDLADRPYPNDNPDGETPLGATLEIVDWVDAHSADARFLIYEGWADLHPFTDELPPSARSWRRYHRHALGDYHDWYLDYVRQLSEARPDIRIGLIPVGQVMSMVMQSDLMEDIEPEALFSDLSPHGTPTTYLLAAMITYADLFDTAPPAGMVLPDEIDSRFAERYDRIAAAVWAAMQGLDKEE